MKHEFLLILADFSELSEELEHAVYEAGFDDSVLTVRGDHVAIEVFDRQGPFRDIVLSAIADLERAGLKVLRVESAVVQTVAEINSQLATA